ncbi:LOW QUALITY PROTEIN: WPP domain-associated protein [Carica papaya]|uniref:LOW QUALITY PROTEIN: WPP domain-associated protein n=1 Tax=Carica papaya TaxID=3649 RepID=UPI000B8C8E51|nr:LOW QUALITY PROTEIN: WPP domain-associated protein [Carica papaya]
MNNLLGGVDDRFRSSIADSTMMWIVHYAMEKAHEKLKEKRGVISQLNETSKFYELAVMQLEGCLKFVQQETGSYILESCHEELISDLTEIKDRLQGRLKESELAILEKDTELTERLENELRLGFALEAKEKELVSLHANLELERAKREGVEEIVMSSCEARDDGSEGELSELKNSVDMQVLSIIQKLEPEKEPSDEGRYLEKPIEKMSSDLDILKGTLDLAFKKMYGALFLSEMGPLEQKWMWKIEKDTIGILIRGFMKEFQHNSEVETKTQENQVLRKYFVHSTKEIIYLRGELEHILEQIEVQLEAVKACGKSFMKPIGKSLSEGDNHISSKNFSFEEKLIKGHPPRRRRGDNGNYVAKMIKNHELIIQRKNEELNWIKRELQPTLKERKYLINPKGKIEESITRLDNLINVNARICESFDDEEDVTYLDESKFSPVDVMNEKNLGLDSLDDVWKKMHQTSDSDGIKEEQCNELGILRQEKEDADLLTVIMEDTYLTLFKSLMNNFYSDLLSQIDKDDIYEKQIREIVNEGLKKIESDEIDIETREEIFYIVFSETTKDLLNHLLEAKTNSLQDATSDDELMAQLREDVHTTTFREAYREWKKSVEIYNDEGLFRQEVNRIVFDETNRDILDIVNYVLYELNKFDISKNFEFIIYEKLGMIISRLENVKLQLHSLIELVASLRRKQLLYKTAFIKRCENLQKAEAEVDLLGDQVDMLVGLHEKTYQILHQHSPVLQSSEVPELLNLIEQEVAAVVDFKERVI